MEDTDELMSITRLAERAGLQHHALRSAMVKSHLLTGFGPATALTAEGVKAGGTMKDGRDAQYVVFPVKILFDPRLQLPHTPPLSTPARAHFQSLSTRKVAEHFSLPANKINALFAQLGWIQRGLRGWLLTQQGASQGGLQRENPSSGETYVLWPASITGNPHLESAVGQAAGRQDAPNRSARTSAPPGGQREPTTSVGTDIPDSLHRELKLYCMSEKNRSIRETLAEALVQYLDTNASNHCCSDGHKARSPSMMLVDNWLFTAGLVHSVNHRLPLEEDVFVDIYLPADRLCLFFGSDQSADVIPILVARLTTLGYKAHHVQDSDLQTPEDGIPRMLARLGAESLTSSLV